MLFLLSLIFSLQNYIYFPEFVTNNKYILLKINKRGKYSHKLAQI